MYSKDKIILIQINYFSIGCNSFLVDWIRIFAIPTQQLRNRYRTCILIGGRMGATVLFLLPQEIITKAITGTDLERKDLSANGNQLKKSSVKYCAPCLSPGSWKP